MFLNNKTFNQFNMCVNYMVDDKRQIHNSQTFALLASDYIEFEQKTLVMK